MKVAIRMAKKGSSFGSAITFPKCSFRFSSCVHKRLAIFLLYLKLKQFLPQNDSLHVVPSLLSSNSNLRPSSIIPLTHVFLERRCVVMKPVPNLIF